MNDPIILALVIFFAVDAVALLFLLGLRIHREVQRNKILHFGDRAEEKVSRYIQKEFPGSVLFDNVFLKTDRGTTQIDHILLCKWGIFVIETKSHNGKIRVGQKEWVQIYGDKVVRLHSPLLQNEIHQKALRRVLMKNRSLSGIPVKGIVVFTSKKVHFSKRVAGLVRLEELAPYIKSGGKTTKRKVPLTARPGTFYLSRQKILSLERLIRKNCVRSRRRKIIHAKAVRRMDRNDVT